MIGTLLAGNNTTSLPRIEQSAAKPLAILLLGPPGAGKGTHASPLSCALNLPHISTGDLFRENMRNQTSIGKKARFYIDQGQLVPDGVVLEMLFERIAGADCLRGYILDGFPRTLPQAEALDRHLGQTHLLVALHFHIDDALLIERITGRIACKQCGRPFHRRYSPPVKEGVCDHCDGPLYQRDDDREEILRKRLEIYRRETAPLIAFYAEKEGALRQINSQNAKDQVFREILDTLFTFSQPDA